MRQSAFATGVYALFFVTIGAIEVPLGFGDRATSPMDTITATMQSLRA
ncbi:MAG: hypothetical protein P8M71_08950 [Pseudomonadales bacterium]|nr:hypothetical protein [Pseudomonadales bacterium]